MPDIADVAWSERDDRNTEAVPNGWPTGAFPAYTDLVGQMMMGATKRFWNKINPIYQTSGTGDTYVVQTEVGVDQINLYELLCVRVDRSNTTSTPTLQFGSTNPRTIVKAGASGYIPLTAGDMYAGNSHTFWYNGAFYVLTDPALIVGTTVQPYSPNLTTWAAITRAAGYDAFAATPSSANLRALVSDETGTGSLVFSNSPTVSLASASSAVTQTPGDNSTKLATTAYVQAAIFATTTLPSSKYATVAALPAVTYANGATGVGATLTATANGALTVDGVASAVNDVILVKNQVSTFQNGIYVVTATGSAGAVFVLTRATYYNLAADINLGDTTYVSAGATLVGTTWTQNGTENPVIGTNPVSFAQTSAPGAPIVILATGQSNITVTPDLAWSPAPNVVKWDWQYGVEANVGTQFLPLDPTKINTSWKFASDLARDNPTRKVYLINIAWSAQTIAHWMAGTGSPDVFQIILNNLPNALTAAGVDHIDMMLWWQGESDAATPTTYIADFETVMTRFKAQSWFPSNIPTVVFSINNSANFGNATRDAFNALLQKCVYADPDNRMFTYGPGSLPISYWTSGSGYNDMTAAGYFVVGAIAYQNWANGVGRKVLSGLSTNYGQKQHELDGSLYLSGTGTVTYTTPGALGIQTKLKMDSAAVGPFAQLIAFGATSASDATARVLSVFDARTVAHQSTLAVFSVNESDLFGLSWDGNNSGGRAYLKTQSSPIGFRINTTDVGGFSTTGYLFVGLGAAAVQGVVGAYQLATVQGSDVALTNSITTAQSVFAAANDALTALAATTYRFKGKLLVATGATTHTTAFGFGGTATLTSIQYQSKLWSGTQGTINTTAPSELDVATAAATVLNATSAAIFTTIEIEGIIRVNAAGTLIPQITFSAGPTGTCAVKVDSFIELWPIGANTVASVGNWG